MLNIAENINLKGYNTFGIEAFCTYFTEVNSIADFQELITHPVFINNERLIIGGGSNILFTKNFNGIVLKNNLKGKEIIFEDNDTVVVKIGAGESWHGFVLWCIEKGFCGVENLSLIPGCVGASPMQNIGAYGVEIKEIFEELEAYDINTGSKKVFKKEECKFGYRESVFKHEFKNQYLIGSVSFKLKKHADVNVSYGAITSELQTAGITNPGIKDVSDAVIRIRQSKLPDPAVTGNAGSFFKNPEVSAEKYNQLKVDFPDLVAYPLANGNYKLAAGWLIEQAGLKGYQHHGAAVHNKQALVLVNMGQAKGGDVMELSAYVLQKVFDKFGVKLEREVNII
ncbi:MAG: UDP-N-acetylenolpyruvoylglucosamine reductase [Bacteroidetes bacterium]|nr:UDP-N-acetylenolpyruvoylglucosamine reductase [Bacteroidota bacterium]